MEFEEIDQKFRVKGDSGTLAMFKKFATHMARKCEK